MDDVMWRSESCRPRTLVRLCTQNFERYLQMTYMKGVSYPYTFESRSDAGEDEHPPPTLLKVPILQLASAFGRKISPLNFPLSFHRTLLGKHLIHTPDSCIQSASPLYQIHNSSAYDPVKTDAAGVWNRYEETAHQRANINSRTKYTACTTRQAVTHSKDPPKVSRVFAEVCYWGPYPDPPYPVA